MASKINTKIELENFIIKNWNAINHYIDDKMKDLPIPVYSSVDVRESLLKFAPVDHNMYPAGFNNLCSSDLKRAGSLFKDVILKTTPNAKTVGIIPESHTKNLFYLDHLHALKTAVEFAGFEASFLTVDDELFAEGENRVELTSHSGHSIKICRAKIENGDLLFFGDTCQKKIDFAILNNDQSKPIPVPWEELKVPVHPTPKIGWYRRQKITHFNYYRKVANEFAEHFNIDPHLLQAMFVSVEDVDFLSKIGLDKLTEAAQSLFSELPKDTAVFMKASQGTYGMGIEVIHSPEEIMGMNRKIRNKMDVGKSGLKFTRILLQEGIETVLKYDGGPAEVTIYLVNGKPTGGFMRANPLKVTKGNLNAKGMVYQKYCISEIEENSEHQIKEAVYSAIARLSTLASGHEIKDVL